MKNPQSEVINVEVELSELYRLQRERVSRDLELEKKMAAPTTMVREDLRFLYDILGLLDSLRDRNS